MVQPRQTRVGHDSFELHLLAGGSREHVDAERELLGRGVPLPLPHRAVWARFCPADAFWFVLVRDSQGRAAGGFTLEVSRSRALPGHLTLCSERLGDSLPVSIGAPALRALADLIRRDPRILRLDIEVFSADGERRRAIGEALDAAGLRPAPLTRSYPETLTSELLLSDDEHLAALSANTRRHIRAVHKRPVELRLIENDAFAPRVDDLLRETLQRTGGTHRPVDWRWRIALSQAAPGESRLIGLFRTDADGPESLLAFAWGCCHGEYGHYDAAGSTRLADLKMSLSYSLMWDLMCWARRGGARWWDFGGITEGHRGSDDPVGGISDFKRHFSTTVKQVGERWVLEPNPVRSGLARGVSALATAFRQLRA
jgi:Acetyltransferase (GNAT) domain